MARRPPAPPPDLPGYTVSKLLGSGGFADVYLYEQHLPRRSVAVKVLIPGAADHELLAQFDAEANLMAALSTHPAIVTIHQAGISGDGRPYMVMEYCSRPNLSARYRAERLTVGEVLRIGIRLAGAVETAHRAGILHRDIKPANVLTTDFGHPVLSDFGISVQSSTPQALAAGGGAVGMSIPWTAPEVFGEQTGGDERADVYSLAASLYTVLARRSPFDRPGGPNGSADLISRIRSAPLPALGRSDVPPSLERVIARAMDKNPAARYATALDFARALQQVEGELRLAPTPIDVLDEDPATAAEQLGDSPATRVRALTVIEPEPTRAADGPIGAVPPSVMPEYDLPPGFPAAMASANEQTVVREPGDAAGRPGSLPVQHHGRHHPGSPSTAHTAGASGARHSRLPLLIGGGVLVVAAAVVAVLLSTRGTDTGPGPVPPSGDLLATSTQQQAVAPPPDPVVALTGTVVDGKSVFSWRNPRPQTGDFYSWQRTDVTTGDEGQARNTQQTRITVDAPDACIIVKVVRNGQPSGDESTCAGR
ncbi:serine/threonine-protein kinase [Nakamurella lactea]|uniref:serine/threonine-protein kinase n=1 Tax=Nakamurella lactea TaxID=459515 RepID=UPI000428E90F|nr:serine/threonine-protein kinase [Nakamurella lactea]